MKIKSPTSFKNEAGAFRSNAKTRRELPLPLRLAFAMNRQLFTRTQERPVAFGASMLAMTISPPALSSPRS